MVRYERFIIWEKVFDRSSPFDTNNDRFLKMSLLRFYPGATPGKKGNKLKIMMKNRKRNRSITKIVLTGNVPQNAKWQTERPWLVFSEEKNVMTCTTCIEFFQSDKISNSFISGCLNLRTLAVTDHEQSKTHVKAIVALSDKGKSVTEK